jgi:hypothetical protein
VSKLRRPFLSDRYFFITVRLLPRRTKLMEADFRLLARALYRARELHPFNEYAGMRHEEQRQRCALIIDRVRIPADPRTRL